VRSAIGVQDCVVSATALTDVRRRTGKDCIISATALTNVWGSTGNDDIIGTTAWLLGRGWREIEWEIFAPTKNFKLAGFEVMGSCCANHSSQSEACFIYGFHVR